jgi:hypothetical protein
MSNEKWDVFISHASEDKAAFVEPLALTLRALGVRVWYDEFSVRLGDSLTRSIDAGLAKSQFGIVVLSHAFLSKRWPEYELSGLTAREMEGHRVIIPIWHQLTKKQLLKFSPTLADKLALRTEDMSLAELAIRLVDEIRPDLATKIHRRIAYLERIDASETKQIEVAKIKPSPIRHKKLPPDVLSRIRLLRAALLPIYPRTFKFWVDGFQRDAHPTREIVIWERLACAFLEYSTITRLTSRQRKVLQDVIFGLIGGRPKAELMAIGKELPRGVENVIAGFDSSVPVFEFKETTSLFSEATGRDPKGLDKELFPKDLPDELIKQVIAGRRSSKTRKKEVRR